MALILDSSAAEPDRKTLFFLLGTCLADEAAARPQTIRAALRELVRSGNLLENADFTPTLTRGRYGADLREEAGKAFLAPDSNLESSGVALLEAIWWQTNETKDLAGYTKTAARFLEYLSNPEPLSRCEGALGFVQLCFELKVHALPDLREACSDSLLEAGPALAPLLFSTEWAEQYAASFALVWLGACRVWTPIGEPDILGRLFMLWRRSPAQIIRDIALRALVNQPLASREDSSRCAIIPRRELEDLLQSYGSLDRSEQPAALKVFWYLQALDDDSIAKHACSLLNRSEPASHALHELLDDLRENL